MTHTSMSGQSLGNMQVNIDQNLNNFYALAKNNNLVKQQSDNSNGLTKQESLNVTDIQTQQRNLDLEDKIQEFEKAGLMTQTLKLDKMKQENFIDSPKESENYKMIEDNIRALQKKYSQEEKTIT